MAVASIRYLVQHLAIEDPKLYEALVNIEEAVLKKGSITINQLGSTVSQGVAGPAGPSGPRGATGSGGSDITTPSGSGFILGNPSIQVLSNITKIARLCNSGVTHLSFDSMGDSIGVSGHIQNLYVRVISTSPDHDIEITVAKNFKLTGLTVTIPANTTTGVLSNITEALVVGPNDIISFVLNSNPNPAAIGSCYIGISVEVIEENISNLFAINSCLVDAQVGAGSSMFPAISTSSNGTGTELHLAIPFACKLLDLIVLFDARGPTQPSSGTLQTSIRKNSVNVLTLTLPATFGLGKYYTNISPPPSFAAGDLLSFKILNNAATTAIGVHQIIARFIPDSATLQTILCANIVGSYGAGTTFYIEPFSDTVSATIDGVSNLSFPITRAGQLKNLYINTTSGQPGTGSFVFTVYQNGIATALQVTIAAGAAAGTFSDLVDILNVVAGDLIYIKMVNNASSGSAALEGWSCEFD